MIKDNQVLITGGNHSLYLADVSEEGVVLDIITNEYYEYLGQELADYEKVVIAKVAR